MPLEYHRNDPLTLEKDGQNERRWKIASFSVVDTIDGRRYGIPKIEKAEKEKGEKITGRSAVSYMIDSIPSGRISDGEFNLSD